MRIFHKTNFNFIKHRKIAYAVSTILLVVGMVSLFVRGLNYGIDFKGGAEVVIRFDKAVDVGDVRSIMQEAGVNGSVKQYGLDRSLLLKTDYQGDTTRLKALISNALSSRLPGIAGIVLTMGMAVDANVLIYERIREELGEGKSLRMAVDVGYKKAFSSIFDSHVTTLAAAFLLYVYGVGPVQGFAVTLMIGTGASLFTAIFVTKVLFNLLLDSKFMDEKSFG